MNVGGEAQRMLLNSEAFVAPPRRGRCRDAIGKEAVDDSG
jgi:hypothetical protein